MSSRRRVALASAAFVLVVVCLVAVRPPSRLRTTRFAVGRDEYRLEIAETPRTRARGLSGRRALARDAGMLFVFEKTGRHTFWMREMSFAIDIVWLDEQWCAVEVASLVRPDSYPAMYGRDAASRYVVELPAGAARAHGVVVGRCFAPPQM